MQRWGELEGSPAYDYAAALSHVHKPSLETAAIVGWAKNNPRTAWDRLMVVSNQGADSRYNLEPVLHVVANSDLSLAIDLYHDLKAGRACLMCNAGVVVITAHRRRQLDLIVQDIAQSPRDPSRDALRDAYWATMGQFSARAMLPTLEQVTETQDAVAARVHFVSGWASRDFPGCFDYMRTHFDAEMLDKTILPAVQSWARGAVGEDVAAVIKELPTNLSERSLLGLVPVLARVDPKSATDWALSFPNSAIRTECLDRAMREWAKADHHAAQVYLLSQQDLETRGILLWSFLLNSVSNATLQLTDLADVTDAFALSWRLRLLERLSLRLADPSANRAGTFDIAAYKDWVEKQPGYDEQQRTTILAPLNAPKR